MFTNQAKADVYEQITNAIIAAIEAGTDKYEMPWHRLDNPINATSRKLYRGVNVLMLWAAAQKLGFPANEWATYRQWQAADAQVRKGERGTTVVFWKFFDGEEQQERVRLTRESATLLRTRLQRVQCRPSGWIHSCNATAALRSHAP